MSKNNVYQEMKEQKKLLNKMQEAIGETSKRLSEYFVGK